jgi:hypothetical protein
MSGRPEAGTAADRFGKIANETFSVEPVRLAKLRVVDKRRQVGEFPASVEQGQP